MAGSSIPAPEARRIEAGLDDLADRLIVQFTSLLLRPGEEILHHMYSSDTAVGLPALIEERLGADDERKLCVVAGSSLRAVSAVRAKTSVARTSSVEPNVQICIPDGSNRLLAGTSKRRIVPTIVTKK